MSGPPASKPIFSGACLCGAVSFTVDAPTKWCAHCHCTMCQRAHGAAFVTWLGVAEGNFRLIDGDSLQWYASSAEAERGFCAVCGSSLFFRSSRWPGEIHIARAAIPGDVDRAPEGHVFAATRVPWLVLEDHLPWRP